MEMTLNLPSNYVEIEEEEMMYLDGGGYWTHRGHADWTYTLSRDKRSKIAAVAAGGVVLAQAIGSIVPTIKGYATAIATLAGVTSALFWYASSSNGFRIYFHTMTWGRTARWAQVI